MVEIPVESKSLSHSGINEAGSSPSVISSGKGEGSGKTHVSPGSPFAMILTRKVSLVAARTWRVPFVDGVPPLSLYAKTYGAVGPVGVTVGVTVTTIA